MYSPRADASALSLVEPLPLVKHMGECASRMCRDQTLGMMLRQEAISILMPRLANTLVILAIVCSSGRSLPKIKVLASETGLRVNKDCASASKFFTSSMTNSGPACTTFLTVQRSIERRIPWRSVAEISSGNST